MEEKIKEMAQEIKNYVVEKSWSDFEPLKMKEKFNLSLDATNDLLERMSSPNGYTQISSDGQLIDYWMNEDGEFQENGINRWGTSPVPSLLSNIEMECWAEQWNIA